MLKPGTQSHFDMYDVDSLSLPQSQNVISSSELSTSLGSGFGVREAYLHLPLVLGANCTGSGFYRLKYFSIFITFF